MPIIIYLCTKKAVKISTKKVAARKNVTICKPLGNEQNIKKDNNENERKSHAHGYGDAVDKHLRHGTSRKDS